MSTERVVPPRGPLVVFAGLVVLGTAALLPLGGARAGATVSFVPAMLAVVVCFDLLSLFLLVGDFRDTGDARVLAMAGAYVWSLVLMGAYALAFPGVVSAHPPLANAASVAPWLYIGWHAGFPTLLGAAWSPWPSHVHPSIEVASRARVAVAALAVTALVSVCSAAAIVLDAHRLPVVIHGLDTSRMTTITAPVVMPLVLLALLSATVGCRTRTGPERWSPVAVLVCLCDLALTYASHYRFSLGWYAGRTLTLTAAGVLLFAMLADVRRAKARAQHNAAHDELTGLFNRRSADEQLEQLIARARRTGGPLSVLLLDLDLFKVVNDSYGHAAGDLLLRDVATTLRGHVRRGDVVARVGGEEFLILLPDTSLDASTAVAEKLRMALAVTHRPHQDHCVTASIGATALREDDTPSMLLRRADQAMYRAKNSGRNRVVSAPAAGALVPTARQPHADTRTDPQILVRPR